MCSGDRLGGSNFSCNVGCNMTQVDFDPSRQLLSVQYSGQVNAGEMEACLERVKHLLKDVEPGFSALTDLSGLETMDASCAPVLGVMMDFLVEKQIDRVVRVVPDPQKDIGFALMSHIHSGREIHTATFESLAEAIQHLAT